MTVYSASDPIFRRDPRKFRLRGGGASVTIGEKNRPDDLELVKAIRERFAHPAASPTEQPT